MERLSSSLSFSQLPAAVQAAARRRGQRGPQQAPTKEKVTMRLSPDLVTAMRATGKGWQAAADQALRDHFLKAGSAGKTR